MLSRTFQIGAAAMISLALFWFVAELGQRAAIWLITYVSSSHEAPVVIATLSSYIVMMGVAIRRRRTHRHGAPG